MYTLVANRSTSEGSWSAGRPGGRAARSATSSSLTTGWCMVPCPCGKNPTNRPWQCSAVPFLHHPGALFFFSRATMDWRGSP